MNNSTYRYLLGAAILAVALMLVFPSSSYAQRLLLQPKNFVAILTGQIGAFQ